MIGGTVCVRTKSSIACATLYPDCRHDHQGEALCRHPAHGRRAGYHDRRCAARHEPAWRSLRRGAAALGAHRARAGAQVRRDGRQRLADRVRLRRRRIARALRGVGARLPPRSRAGAPHVRGSPGTRAPARHDERLRQVHRPRSARVRGAAGGRRRPRQADLPRPGAAALRPDGGPRPGARAVRDAPRARNRAGVRQRAGGRSPRLDRGGARRGARDHPAVGHGGRHRPARPRSRAARAAMTDEVLLTLSLLLMGALLARFVASLINVPEILVLVAIGAGFGPSALDVVDVPFDSLGAQLMFTLGVSLILFYGGLSLSLPVLRKVWVTLAMLAVPGMLLTAAVVGVAAHFAFDLPWDAALLVGAVLAPTDPAILIPLFIRSRLKPKVAQTVIAESAFNDPTGAALALTLAGVILTGSDSLAEPATEFLVDLAISTLIGIVAGIVLAASISSHRMGIWRESAAIAVLTVVTISFFSLDTAGGSGYLGAFLAGLIVGNMEHLGLGEADQPHVQDVRHFAFNLADIVTLIVFMVLGANIPFDELGDNLLPAIAVLATLMLVARPLTVLACTMPDRGARWTRQELAFLCWTRETGVVPAALVGVLAGLGVPEGDVFASVVALAIVLTLVLQALPARWLADRLGLLEPRAGPVAVEREAA